MIIGQRFVMRSPLPLEQVKQRIKLASGSVFVPFRPGIRGGVFLNRLWLDHSELGWPLTYNAAPRLTGRLQDALGSTEIHARFGPPPLFVPFFIFWYAFLAFITIVLILAVVSDRSDLDWEVLPYGFGMLAVFLVFPAAMHYLLTRNSAAKLEHILDFLKQEVQATKIIDGRG